jgi:adenylyltransferase/sulfurtransferase
MEMRQVRVRRDPNCVVCGDNPTVTQLIDYDEFCGTAPVGLEGATA